MTTIHQPAAGGVRAPSLVYAPSTRAPNYIDEAQLRDALAVRERRRVRRDTTVSVLGGVYELEQGFLAGRVVDIVYSHFDDPLRPEVEHEGKRYALSLVDRIRNARRERPMRRPHAEAPDFTISFDPSRTTLGDANSDEEDFDAVF